MFGQTFAPGDLATVGFLVVLEGLLSIDNALVLGVLAQRVEPSLRMRALSYGLIGGLLLRLAAIAAAAMLLRFSILKLLGGLYLLWISLNYFARRKVDLPSKDSPSVVGRGFWRTIAAVELTDLAFAADSILAAVALVGAAPPGSKAMFHPKFWVIAVGGMLGIVIMRFAAAAIAKILGRFPRLHRSAYLLVLLIGIKLLIDFAANNPNHPHRVDFQDPAGIELWLFWLSALLSLALGITGPRPPK
jgi:YkoY family integral membrane protein